MKFVHISDLHLGKRLHETSLIEDQEAVLAQILEIIEVESPDGLLVAGDVYDKSVPSAEAVALFDAFLTSLSQKKVKTFIISGNHDSAERIAFGSQIMRGSGVYLSPVYDGEIKPVTLTDDYGEVDVYTLPFIKPLHVRKAYPEAEIDSYTDALRKAVEEMRVDESKRNVLVTHQFVTGASRSDSEETVGGTDNVDGAVFAPFDYVALGHLHGAQNCGDKRIRYCGTPLKYSFSECADEKSVTIVELGRKGELTIRTIPLRPLRDMQKIRGDFKTLTDENYYKNLSCLDDYLQITLTDEDDVPDAMARLQQIYKYALELRYDNTRTRKNAEILGAEDTEKKSAYDLFSEFFVQQNNAEMSSEQREFMRALIEKIEEGEV